MMTKIGTDKRGLPIWKWIDNTKKAEPKDVTATIVETTPKPNPKPIVKSKAKKKKK